MKLLYAVLSKNKVETTKEIIRGQFYVDFDKGGKVCGVEILGALDIKVEDTDTYTTPRKAKHV